MRIALVARRLDRAGGAETYLETVINALIEAGHAVALLASEGRSSSDPLRISDACTVVLAGTEGTVEAIDELRRWRPEIVFSQGLDDLDTEAAAMALAPSALFAHDYYGTCISGTKLFQGASPQPCEQPFGAACLANYFPRRCGGRSPITMLRRYAFETRRHTLLKRYSAILTASRHMRAHFIVNGCREDQVRVVGLPIREQPSTPPANLTPRGEGTRQPHRILFLGRMTTLKGGQLLIHALPLVRSELARPLTVTMAGHGPARSAWQAAAGRINSDGISIEFPGWIESSAVSKLFDCADLLVLPSVWPEPFGMTGLEAGLRGVPTVAFAVGGIPEWLHDDVNGYLASELTADALASAMIRVLRDPAAHARLRAGARATASSFNTAVHIEKLISAFADIASQRAGSRPVHSHGHDSGTAENRD